MSITYIVTGIHHSGGAGPRSKLPMTTVRKCCAVVGAGKLGAAMVVGLKATGLAADGPLGRGADAPAEADMVLLCVPDEQISAAAEAITPRPGLLVGHCSGAATLAPLSPHDSFSIHPLMTVTGAETDLRGAPAAVAGSTDAAYRAARELAIELGMEPFAIADQDRAAYHAGASIASNFLITLEWMAAKVGGLERSQLAPLIRASIDNWERLGPEAALTGPIARGDEQTVAAQREAVVETAPEFLELFDALTGATRTLAEARSEVMA